MEVESKAPTSPGEDPQTNIEVGARGVTVSTTSRTQPREWWKKGALPSTVLNLNPLYSIVNPISVAEVEVNDVTTRALLDTGATTNVMTLAYAKKLELEPQPITNLMKRKVTFNGVRNSRAVLKGYIEFNLQVLGLSHFNQDHVTLLVKDKSKFTKKIPLILRTKVVCFLARRLQELGCHALTDEDELELKNHKCLSNKGVPNLLSHKEIVRMAKMEYLPTHSNTIIKGRTQLVLCGTKMNVMTEPLR